MEWDDVLRYDQEIRYMAKRWASRYNPSLEDDAYQHAAIRLFESLDLSAAENERNFVLGALNNILFKFFRKEVVNQDKRNVSLNALEEHFMQVDTDGKVIWPGYKNNSSGYPEGSDNE